MRLSEVEVGRRPASGAVGEPARSVSLTPEQDSAVAEIVAAIDSGDGRELLLHGVTGSGKTEVYLAAAAAALERGRGAIVLVPEIGLTPQTLARFRGRFGDAVALLHSRLPAGARYDEWRRLRAGDARLCVGPRSAIFAPLADLGLIVIDEEHDSSYKQEGDPRYDARERRPPARGGRGSGARGGQRDAAPESWSALRSPRAPAAGRRARAAAGGGARHARGDRRGGTAAPAYPRGARGTASRARQGDRAAQPPRLVAVHELPLVRSRLGVPECDVSLVVHRGRSGLACHHCGHAEPIPESCPRMRVGDDLARTAPGRSGSSACSPSCWSRCPSSGSTRTAPPAGGHLEILTRFQEADAGVLLGTQMVAKGHDFADVVLSVVLDADASLRFPDFRAEERTFALVAQLAGRSGRGEGGGRVLVQTLAPDAPAIEAAARHDTPGFLAGELERRRALRYPPFSHLVRVEVPRRGR